MKNKEILSVSIVQASAAVSIFRYRELFYKKGKKKYLDHRYEKV